MWPAWLSLVAYHSRGHKFQVPAKKDLNKQVREGEGRNKRAMPARTVPQAGMTQRGDRPRLPSGADILQNVVHVADELVRGGQREGVAGDRPGLLDGELADQPFGLGEDRKS